MSRLDNVLVSVSKIFVCGGKKSMCLAATGRLQGWADKLMLCVLGFLSILISFLFINLAQCFCLGGLRTTVLVYEKLGISERLPVHRNQKFDASQTLSIYH